MEKINRAMSESEILDAVSSWGRGTFHTLAYLKTEKQKGLSDFETRMVYKIHYADYENKKAVLAYREATGIQPNNSAVKNEEATDIFGVYLNVKSNALKLRVPLNGCEVLSVEYSIGGKPVTKEEYYSEYVNRGYTIPKKYESKTGVEFRAFHLSKILWVR